MAPSPPPAHPLLQAAPLVPSLGHQEDQPCIVTAVAEVGLSGPSDLLQLLDDEAGLLQGLPQEFLVQGQSRSLLSPTMKKGVSKLPLSTRWPPGRSRVLRWRRAWRQAWGVGQAAWRHREEVRPSAGGRTAGSGGRSFRPSHLSTRVTALLTRSSFPALLSPDGRDERGRPGHAHHLDHSRHSRPFSACRPGSQF